VNRYFYNILYSVWYLTPDLTDAPFELTCVFIRGNWWESKTV